MIWLAVALLAATALAPVVITAWRGERMRNRRDAAMALHRAQLGELDRDLSQGRLLEPEHAAAKLEVQRRLLGDASLADDKTTRSGPLPLVIVAALVPAVALVLYVADGHPDYKAQAEAATAGVASARDLALISELRAMVAQMDPKSARAREGNILLGRAELARGHLPEAATAWRAALVAKYEPALAAETAEVITEAEGKVTPEAADLFKRALADTPADAPWKSVAQKRLTESGGS